MRALLVAAALCATEGAMAKTTCEGGPGWAAACEAALAHNAALLEGRAATVGPVTDPDGSTFPGYVELRADGALLDRQLVASDRVVTWRDGRVALEAALRDAGFPRTLVSPTLLADLLQYFALLPPGFAYATRQSWEPLAHAVLRHEGDGAVLVLEKADAGVGGGGAGLPPLVPRRLEVRFDADARLSMRLFEDRGSGMREVPLPRDAPRP